MQIFDSKKYQSELDEKITKYLKDNPIDGSLGIIQIGDDAESSKYIQLKKKFCAQVGIQVQHLKTDSKEKCLEFMNSAEITGVIIQLPLPMSGYYDLLTKIPEYKDIDCLNKSHFISPVVRGFDLFFNELGHVKNAVIIGDGVLVGVPIYNYLINKGIITKIETNYVNGTKIEADLLVIGVGIEGLVLGECLTSGTNVVDFGYKSFDINSSVGHLGLVGQSPGGMGPLVIRFLVMNFLGI